MKVKFYKVTVTDGHLTKDVVLPAKNVIMAQLQLQNEHHRVVGVKYLGWQYVNVFIGLEGLHFYVHINGHKILLKDQHHGFEYLRHKMGN